MVICPLSAFGSLASLFLMVIYAKCHPKHGQRSGLNSS